MDLLIKRGSKKAVDLYIGQKGELFLDQENDSLRMSDASTAGGLEILKKDHNGDCVIGSKRVTWIHNSTNNGCELPQCLSIVASCPESPYCNFLSVPGLLLVTGVNFGSSCRIPRSFKPCCNMFKLAL